VAMLYSRAPHDSAAIVAHLGKVAGYLIVLVSLLQMTSADMRERTSQFAAIIRSSDDAIVS
jgi:hypothetical protein